MLLIFHFFLYFNIYRRRELGRDGFGKKIFSEDLKIEKDESEKKNYLILYLRKFTYFVLPYFYYPLPCLLILIIYIIFYLFIYSFIYLLIYLVIYSFVYSFINLIIYLFIYAIIYLFNYIFIHLLISIS